MGGAIPRQQDWEKKNTKQARKKANIKRCIVNSLQIFEKSSQLLGVCISHMEPPTVWNNPTEGNKRGIYLLDLLLPSPPSPASQLCYTALQGSQCHTALHLSPKWWKKPEPLWIQSAQILTLEQLWLFPGKVWSWPSQCPVLVLGDSQQTIGEETALHMGVLHWASSQAPRRQQGPNKSGEVHKVNGIQVVCEMWQGRQLLQEKWEEKGKR